MNRAKSCERRSQDFGGCPLPGIAPAGDAAATDPVCSLSPDRGRVDAILQIRAILEHR